MVNLKGEEIPLEEMEKTRQELVGRYSSYKEELQRALSSNETIREKPLVTVVVSLWEQDESMIASKMFDNSIQELLRQSEESGVDLDIIVVANNGGGANEDLGDGLKGHLRELFDSNGELSEKYDLSFNETETIQPEGEYQSNTPWGLEIPERGEEVSNRVVLVNQAHDPANAGKIRALRDVSHALANDIINQRYSTDLIFQIDAETILSFEKEELGKIKTPFRTMIDQLGRNPDLIAVGTKDKFEVINPETGKPFGIPRPTAQEGFMKFNRNKFISLPGGALMARPEDYLAGMMAISELTPGIGTEDYLFTKLVKNIGGDEVEGKIKSLGIINHLNRTPEGAPAVDQLLRWRQQAAAVDMIFPGNPYQTESLDAYVFAVVKSRLENFVEKRDLRYMTQVVKDILDLPEIVKMIQNSEVADIFNGLASWIHKSK